MKNLLFSLLLLFAAVSTHAQTNLENFLSDFAFETVSTMAHPTNTYVAGYYAEDANSLTIRVVSNDWLSGRDVSTQIRLTKRNGYYTSLRLDFDQDSSPPFVAIELIKDLLIDLLEEDQATSRQVIQGFEQYLQKSLQYFSGEELVLVALNIGAMLY